MKFTICYKKSVLCCSCNAAFCVPFYKKCLTNHASHSFLKTNISAKFLNREIILSNKSKPIINAVKKRWEYIYAQSKDLHPEVFETMNNIIFSNEELHPIDKTPSSIGEESNIADQRPSSIDKKLLPIDKTPSSIGEELNIANQRSSFVGEELCAINKESHIIDGLHIMGKKLSPIDSYAIVCDDQNCTDRVAENKCDTYYCNNCGAINQVQDILSKVFLDETTDHTSVSKIMDCNQINCVGYKYKFYSKSDKETIFYYF